jgi:hypothetical protein
MPRRPIHRFWQDRIKELTENFPGISAEAVEATLRQNTAAARRAGASDAVPTPRTIARYIRAFKPQPEQDRLAYRYASWPESMESVFLPWEASRPLLDLLYERLKNYKGSPEAAMYTLPTNLEARWFWRLTLAAPTLPIEQRANMAKQIADTERFFPPDEVKRVLEHFKWQLTFQTWRDDRKIEYEAAQKVKVIPESLEYSAWKARKAEEQAVAAKPQKSAKKKGQ